MSYHKIIHRMEVKETNQTSILNPKTTPKYFHRYKHDVAYSLHTQLYKQIVRTISYIHLSIWNKNNQFILHFIKAYDNIPWFYEAAFAVETCEQWPTTTCVVDLLHFVEELLALFTDQRSCLDLIDFRIEILCSFARICRHI